MEASNWDFLQLFTPQFQAMRSEIESRLTAASSATPGTVSADELNAVSALLATAAKAIADAAGAIPTYDQKQYESQLKAFSKTFEELRATSAPKSKFSFKRKAPTSGSAAKHTPSPASSTTDGAPVPLPVPASSASAIPAPPPSDDSSSSHLLLSGHTNRYLTRADLPTHTSETDLALADLNNCVVDLFPPLTDAATVKATEAGEEPMNLTALHVRNLKDCVVLLPHVKGSALLHDMERCIILLGSHQFRMHTSKRIDILLSISSTPIIEHCSAIRFAQYPAVFEPVSKPLPMYTVQDFSHIRATPSPNFSVMSEEESEHVQKTLEALVSARPVVVPQHQSDGRASRVLGLLLPM